MLCVKCKIRPAIVMVQKLDGSEAKTEGYCLKCAKELNLPQITSMLESIGISEDEIEQMEDMMNTFEEELEESDFERGGSNTMSLLNKMLGGGTKPTNELTVGDKDEQEESKSGTKQSRKKSSKSKEKKRKFLGTYCTNLCDKARRNELDNIIGRDDEIYRVIQILSRRSKNNPCLIGEPGVGKTAIAEGIAQKIVSQDVPFRLLHKEIFLLDLTALVAGTQFRGQFESRIKGLIEEVKADGNIILFIDEVHTLVGAGDSDNGAMNAANIMKPSLSRGEIQVIGATTFNEYRKNIEKDAALERRFQPVSVNEPSIEDTLDIIRGVKKYYELHHNISVNDEIVKLAVLWSERYITDRFLPDKAIDLIDEACSCASLRNKDLTEYEKANHKLKELMDKEKALEESKEPDFEAIAKVKAEIMSIKDSLIELERNIADIQVEVSDLAKVIELCTGISASKIEESDYKKLKNLDSEIKKKVVGQDETVTLVAKAIKRNRMQLSSKKRPASFIFVGPTGVGKTELVKVLSETLFNSIDPIIRIDMSEFMEKYSVSRLIGSPPGYVGYDDAGQLTEKVRRKPYSVVLFDEIEKAHQDVMNILLQILDEGKIADSHGRVVNFENTVIIMTSNAGSVDKSGIVGFNKTSNQLQKDKAIKALSEFLRPEFMGRIDEVAVFNSLTEEDMLSISKLQLEELQKAVTEKNIELKYDDEVVELIAKKSDGSKYNARDIRKVIRKDVEDKITEFIIDNYSNNITGISLSVEEDEVVVTTV